MVEREEKKRKRENERKREKKKEKKRCSRFSMCVHMLTMYVSAVSCTDPDINFIEECEHIKKDKKKIYSIRFYFIVQVTNITFKKGFKIL